MGTGTIVWDMIETDVVTDIFGRAWILFMYTILHKLCLYFFRQYTSIGIICNLCRLFNNIGCGFSRHISLVWLLESLCQKTVYDTVILVAGISTLCKILSYRDITSVFDLVIPVFQIKSFCWDIFIAGPLFPVDYRLELFWFAITFLNISMT